MAMLGSVIGRFQELCNKILYGLWRFVRMLWAMQWMHQFNKETMWIFIWLWGLVCALMMIAAKYCTNSAQQCARLVVNAEDALVQLLHFVCIVKGIKTCDHYNRTGCVECLDFKQWDKAHCEDCFDWTKVCPEEDDEVCFSIKRLSWGETMLLSFRESNLYWFPIVFLIVCVNLLLTKDTKR